MCVQHRYLRPFSATAVAVRGSGGGIVISSPLILYPLNTIPCYRIRSVSLKEHTHHINIWQDRSHPRIHSTTSRISCRRCKFFVHYFVSVVFYRLDCNGSILVEYFCGYELIKE